MASYKIPYPGLNESLKHLRLQVIESLPYVAKHTPRMTDPKQIFDYAKKNFRYKNDPPGVEFFQTVPTLLTDNAHFKAGEGDCDDATIYILSLLLINGLPAGIVLAGRNKYRPTHIYAYTEQGADRYNLDLTNKNYNQIRHYPFKQYIPFNLSKDEKNMYLQLADSAPTRQRKKFNRIAVSKPKLKILTDSEKGQAVYIPSKNVFIPAERFDKMKPQRVTETLLSEGYEPEQINEFLSGRAERKARKAQRQATKKAKTEIKLAKKQAKVEKVKAKTEVKKAKAEKKRAAGEAKKMRAEAKIIKSQAKMRSAESGEEPAYKSIIRTAGNVVSKFIPSQEEEVEEVEGEEVEQEEIESPEEVEAVEAEEMPTDEEMSEGFNLTTNDFIKLGLSIGLGYAERKGLFK